MTRSMTSLATAACLPTLLGGCAAVVATQPRAYPERAVDVPPAHLPPPGACRIWFPDRPPGQPPPPGNCHELQRQVPRGRSWCGVEGGSPAVPPARGDGHATPRTPR